MEVKFLAPAQAELEEAVAYYETQKEGLGSQFTGEVKRAIHRILEYPEAWAPCRPSSSRLTWLVPPFASDYLTPAFEPSLVPPAQGAAESSALTVILSIDSRGGCPC